jgi:hypothetical protein
MSERDEYRAKAKYCREMANKAVSPLDKDAWLQLASDWLTMSSMRDRTASSQCPTDSTHQTKHDSEH